MCACVRARVLCCVVVCVVCVVCARAWDSPCRSVMFSPIAHGHLGVSLFGIKFVLPGMFNSVCAPSLLAARDGGPGALSLEQI